MSGRDRRPDVFLEDVRQLRRSPTMHQWVPLSCDDVAALVSYESIFGSDAKPGLHRPFKQSVYFWRNWPIRYVAIAGYVVVFEKFDTRWVMELDDGSGRRAIAIRWSAGPSYDVHTQAPVFAEVHGLVQDSAKFGRQIKVTEFRFFADPPLVDVFKVYHDVMHLRKELLEPGWDVETEPLET